MDYDAMEWKAGRQSLLAIDATCGVAECVLRVRQLGGVERAHVATPSALAASVEAADDPNEVRLELLARAVERVVADACEAFQESDSVRAARKNGEDPLDANRLSVLVALPSADAWLEESVLKALTARLTPLRIYPVFASDAALSVSLLAGRRMIAAHEPRRAHIAIGIGRRSTTVTAFVPREATIGEYGQEVPHGPTEQRLGTVGVGMDAIADALCPAVDAWADLVPEDERGRLGRAVQACPDVDDRRRAAAWRLLDRLSGGRQSDFDALVGADVCEEVELADGVRIELVAHGDASDRARALLEPVAVLVQDYLQDADAHAHDLTWSLCVYGLGGRYGVVTESLAALLPETEPYVEEQPVSGGEPRARSWRTCEWRRSGSSDIALPSLYVPAVRLTTAVRAAERLEKPDPATGEPRALALIRGYLEGYEERMSAAIAGLYTQIARDILRFYQTGAMTPELAAERERYLAHADSHVAVPPLGMPTDARKADSVHIKDWIDLLFCQELRRNLEELYLQAGDARDTLARELGDAAGIHIELWRDLRYDFSLGDMFQLLLGSRQGDGWLTGWDRGYKEERSEFVKACIVCNAGLVKACQEQGLRKSGFFGVALVSPLRFDLWWDGPAEGKGSPSGLVDAVAKTVAARAVKEMTSATNLWLNVRACMALEDVREAVLSLVPEKEELAVHAVYPAVLAMPRLDLARMFYDANETRDLRCQMPPEAEEREMFECSAHAESDADIVRLMREKWMDVPGVARIPGEVPEWLRLLRTSAARDVAEADA